MLNVHSLEVHRNKAENGWNYLGLDNTIYYIGVFHAINENRLGGAGELCLP